MHATAKKAALMRRPSQSLMTPLTTQPQKKAAMMTPR